MNALIDPIWLQLSPLEWLLLATLSVLIPVDSFLNQRRFIPLPPGPAVAWRQKQYRQTMTLLWSACVLSLGVWWLQGGSLIDAGLIPRGPIWQSALGFGVAISAGFFLLYSGKSLSEDDAATALQSFEHDPVLKQFTPHSTAEQGIWSMVSLTAGITEEVIYRGVLLGILTPLLGIWGAALGSLALFSLGHVYQGPKSVARVAMIGAVLTGLVMISGSIWPAVILHAIIDQSSGRTLIKARELVAQPA